MVKSDTEVIAPVKVRRAFEDFEDLGYKLRFINDHWIAWHPVLMCMEIKENGTSKGIKRLTTLIRLSR